MKTAEDINAIASADVTIQVFERCGITQLLKVILVGSIANAGQFS